MSVAFCDFTELREALKRHDWRILRVTDECMKGIEIASVRRRTNAAIMCLPAAAHFGPQTAMERFRYEICHSGQFTALGDSIVINTGTPYTTVARIRSYLLREFNRTNQHGKA